MAAVSAKRAPPGLPTPPGDLKELSPSCYLCLRLPSTKNRKGISMLISYRSLYRFQRLVGVWEGGGDGGDGGRKGVMGVEKLKMLSCGSLLLTFV